MQQLKMWKYLNLPTTSTSKIVATPKNRKLEKAIEEEIASAEIENKKKSTEQQHGTGSDCETNKAIATNNSSSGTGDMMMGHAAKRCRGAGPNRSYLATEKAVIGRYAAEHTNIKAVKKYNIPESTIRGFKTAYLKELKNGGPMANPNKITALQHKTLGRPLKLGSLDLEVNKILNI